jgi:hypothetical protein
MNKRNVPWKAEWKAAGLDPGPLKPEEEALVPDLRRENEAFLTRHPFQKPAPVKRTPLLWSVPLAAAAAVLFAVLPLAGPATDVGLEHVKGADEPALAVYRQGQGGPEKLAPGAVVHPGDILQAAYKVPRAVQGALVSVDGNRNVTVHLSQGGRSRALTDGGERPLESSYELDKAPRFEVFFLLVSNKPFDLAPVLKVVKDSPWESLKPGAFGPDVQFAVLPLVKEVSR